MSALFNFHSFLTVVLLVICTCTYIKMQFPAMLEQRTGAHKCWWGVYYNVFCRDSDGGDLHVSGFAGHNGIGRGVVVGDNNAMEVAAAFVARGEGDVDVATAVWAAEEVDGVDLVNSSIAFYSIAKPCIYGKPHALDIPLFYIRFRGFFWKAARIGERLSPWVAMGCFAMGVSIIIF
ncbi:hypothetical protein IEQ34_017183 [Dendrobium chrysotoxum]|uniref:Protein kish n=1 Tax=Dendrobium chrysotoxum TaxID=161865 RepID=A0AAV7GAJ0_DENCH|nr:hypothetical protein IEQ34_017183 [Dendrobium chrysotoxum]